MTGHTQEAKVSPQNILIDGKSPGNVHEFAITCTNESMLCTVKYEVGGGERQITVPLDAVSFEVHA